jgi:hypothetical protein
LRVSKKKIYPGGDPRWEMIAGTGDAGGGHHSRKGWVKGPPQRR